MSLARVNQALGLNANHTLPTLSGSLASATSVVGALNALAEASVTASQVGAANGVASLDSTGRMPSSQLPASISGAMVYQGTWNASTNTPTITSSSGTKGWYYKVSVAGSTTINGNSGWSIGDLIIFDGTSWEQVQGSTSDVSSVFGRTGAVTLQSTDIATALGFTPYSAANPSNYLTASSLPLGSTNVAGVVQVDGTSILSTGGVIRSAVASVAGKTGAVSLVAADISGLSTVATTNNYNDLTNKPAVYSLPTASTSVLGGVKVDGSTVTINSNGIISANTYSLPIGSASTLGGVKQGSNVTINGSGVISVAAPYTLPIASTSVLGGVKVDGSTVTINSNGVISSASAYSLPIGSASTLGGVKQGSNVTIAGDGTLSVAAPYSLPVATASVLGGVKVDGSTVTISNGVISSASAYSLPIASASVLGGVKQGSNVTINGSGVISVAAPYSLPVATASVLGGVKAGSGVTIAGDGTISAAGTYSLPNASTTVLGGVKVDGTTITINGSGVISGANTYSLPTASTSVLGGVKVDGTTITVASGVISAAAQSATSTAAITTWTGTPYDIGGSISGEPGDGETCIRFLAARAFNIPANFTGSFAKTQTAAAASAVFSVLKNGSVVATITFAAAATTGTFSTQAAINFTAGDRFSLVGPVTADATLSDIDFAIAATMA